jgi:hypothetical protein
MFMKHALVIAIDGRLLDIEFPRWLRYPVVCVWHLYTTHATVWPHGSPIGIALFALFLIVGCSIPGKQIQVEPAPVGWDAGRGNEASGRARAFPTGLLVGPVGFLRSLLTLTCLWLPMILLDIKSDGTSWVWLARLGYLVLSIVWLIRLLGRLADADRLPGARYGHLIVVLVLCVGMLSHGRFGRKLQIGRGSLLERFTHFVYAVTVVAPCHCI